MSEGTLTEELLYEGADTPVGSVEVSNLKYAGFSVQHFKDLSILLRCTKLQMIMFRSCGFDSIPQELFKITSLQKIDLSGNRISTLPGKDKWEALKNLKAVDLSDNNISKLEEVLKISSVTNLRQLMLTGNICLSVQDSFTRICKAYPNLTILNDLIITSQHRAYLDNYALYDNSSTIPLSKTDDFFFLYVRYMHVSSQERYIRKFNAEFFCLNKVIRKYSAAEHIQSVFRGYVQRTEYKRMRHAAITIECKVKYWYKKRLQAAIKIKSCFLYYLTRQKIKFIRSVRLIQSTWRRIKSRKHAVIDAFDMNDGNYEFYTTEEGIKVFKDYINDKGLPEPLHIEKSNYEVLKMDPHERCKLPGSPLVYYTVNNTILLRKVNNRVIRPGATIWCSHDHLDCPRVQRATPDGINWARKCCFITVKPIKSNVKIRKVALKEYPRLFRVVYNNEELFTQTIFSLLDNHKTDLTLFPKRTIDSATSQLTIQSAFRCFLERVKNFKAMKKEAIETRALNIIRYWFKTVNINKSIQYIIKINRYAMSIPTQTAFYVPNYYFSKLQDLPPKYKVDFGFSSDKSLVLSKNVDGVLPLFIPKGHILFGLNEPASLIKFGTTCVKANPSFFSDSINQKWVKRAHIYRVTFSTATEAKNRLLLFAWVTGLTNVVLTEKGVLEHCAAAAIQNIWIGHGTRKMLRCIGIKADLIMRLAKKRERKQMKLYYADEHPEDQKRGRRRNKLDPEEAISRLRGDYRLTLKTFQQYKENKKEEEEKKAKNYVKPLPSLPPSSIEDAFPKATVLLQTGKDKLDSTTASIDQDARTIDNGSESKKIVISMPSTIKSANGSYLENTANDSFFSTQSPKTRTPISGVRTPNRPVISSSDNSTNNSGVITPNRPSIESTENLLNTAVRIPSKLNLDSTENSANSSSRKTPNFYKAGASDSFLNMNSKTPNFYKAGASDSFLNMDSKTPNRFKIGSSDSCLNFSSKKPNHYKIGASDNCFFMGPRTSSCSKIATETTVHSSARGPSKLAYDLSDKSKSKGNSPDISTKSDTSFSKYDFEKPQTAQSLAKYPRKSSHNPYSAFCSPGDFPMHKAKKSHIVSSRSFQLYTGKKGVNMMDSELVKGLRNESETKENVQEPEPEDDFIVSKSTKQLPYVKSTVDGEIFNWAEIIKKEEEENEKEEKEKEATPKKLNTQVSDHTAIEKQRNVFRRIVRLRQICDEVEQQNTSDNSVQIKKDNADRAREELVLSRMRIESHQQQTINDTMQRNRIEKMELQDEITEKREQVTKERTEKIKKIKEKREKKMEKLHASVQFGRAFISASRAAAHIVEVANKQKKQSSSSLALRNTVSSFRSSSQKSKEKAKEKQKEIEEQRRRTAALDKVAVEMRRKKRESAAIDKLEALYADKRISRERSKLAGRNSKNEFVYVEPPKPVIISEVEEAYNEIVENVGSNIGFTEGHELAELLQSYLDE